MLRCNYSRIELSTWQYPPGILLSSYFLPLAPTSHIIAFLEGSLRAVGAEIDGLVLLTSAMPAFLCSVGRCVGVISAACNVRENYVRRERILKAVRQHDRVSVS